MKGQSEIAFLSKFDVNCDMPTSGGDIIEDVFVK